MLYLQREILVQELCNLCTGRSVLNEHQGTVARNKHFGSTVLLSKLAVLFLAPCKSDLVDWKAGVRPLVYGMSYSRTPILLTETLPPAEIGDFGLKQPDHISARYAHA